ncbi:DUF366 family protein [bacterium]|nr:DUF366 family protein [bacterium]
MKTKLIDEEIKYTGLELAPHWIYKNFKIQGDAIVAFLGECEVKLTEMVDVEDVINNEPIYSKKMINFICETFNIGMVEGVLRQRLLITTLKEVLEQDYNIKVVRDGDDLFIDGKKLSVSIATKSATSVLIHTGVNIDSTGAPVDAAELNSIKGIDTRKFAQKVIEKYANEIEDIVLATTKVSGR